MCNLNFPVLVNFPKQTPRLKSLFRSTFVARVMMRSLVDRETLVEVFNGYKRSKNLITLTVNNIRDLCVI
jgi:hypothetical protein